MIGTAVCIPNSHIVCGEGCLCQHGQLHCRRAVFIDGDALADIRQIQLRHQGHVPAVHMHANQDALAGRHFLKEGMGVGLSLPQIHPGQSGFLHPIDIAEHAPVVSQSKAPVLVNPEGEAAV